MNIDQLLEFCAYFTLVKNSSELTTISLPCKSKPKIEEPNKKKEKATRRKF